VWHFCTTRPSFRLSLAPVFLAAAFLVACGDDDAGGANGGGIGTAAAASAGAAGSSAASDCASGLCVQGVCNAIPFVLGASSVVLPTGGSAHVPLVLRPWVGIPIGTASSVTLDPIAGLSLQPIPGGDPLHFELVIAAPGTYPLGAIPLRVNGVPSSPAPFETGVARPPLSVTSVSPATGTRTVQKVGGWLGLCKATIPVPFATLPDGSVTPELEIARGVPVCLQLTLSSATDTLDEPPVLDATAGGHVLVPAATATPGVDNVDPVLPPMQPLWDTIPATGLFDLVAKISGESRLLPHALRAFAVTLGGQLALTGPPRNGTPRSPMRSNIDLASTLEEMPAAGVVQVIQGVETWAFRQLPVTVPAHVTLRRGEPERPQLSFSHDVPITVGSRLRHLRLLGQTDTPGSGPGTIKKPGAGVATRFANVDIGGAATALEAQGGDVFFEGTECAIHDGGLGISTIGRHLDRVGCAFARNERGAILVKSAGAVPAHVTVRRGPSSTMASWTSSRKESRTARSRPAIARRCGAKRAPFRASVAPFASTATPR
jgi:hypothetical protein